MKNNFLCIDLLSTFSEKELEDLTHFVSCRYFNTDRYVIQLLEVLKKDVLGKRTYDAERQVNVYRKVFSDLPAPKGGELDKKEQVLLNHKLNALTRLSERYLSVEAQASHPVYKCELLYPDLLERGQFRLYNRHINRDKKQLQEQVVKGEQYYAQRYKIEKNLTEYLYLNGRLGEEGNFQQATHHLDISYLLNRLDLYLSELSVKNISIKKNSNDPDQIESIQQLLELPQYAENPLIKIYLANIALVKTKEDAKHIHLLNLLDEYGNLIPPKLLKDFYISITNYFIAQIISGKLEYNKNMFDLYKTMHEKALLSDNGLMSPRTIKNIITVSCKVEAFDWVTKVLEYYRPLIQKSVRESVYQFNLGVIAFYQKDYETAHHKLLQVGEVNTTYDINVRILILKCLYETGKDYSEPTIQSFRTAENFFKNQKALTGRNKKAYKNFTRILINLYRIRHQASKMTILRLKEKLEQQEVNCDKRWLLEKMEELKK